MGCPALTYHQKEDRNFFQGLWKKSGGSEKSYKYYPFGLQTSTSWTRENTIDNNYLYNAANELNKTTGWYEMFYRGYDPAIGRMLQIDPYAPMYASSTTYNYALNNPVMMNDPSGGQTYAPPGTSVSGYNRMMRLTGRDDSNQDYSTWYDDDGGGSGSGAITGPYAGFWNNFLSSVDYSFDHSISFGNNSKGDFGYWEPFSGFDNSSYDDSEGLSGVTSLGTLVVGERFVTIQQTQGDGLNFATLWGDYGSGISHTDKDGKEIFGDYCAINLSEALIKSGLSPAGTKCWGNCSTAKRHTIRAQELSNWLQSSLTGVTNITGKDFQDKISGKTGIVFFQNYYEGSEGSMTGDHIDLWNKNEMGSYGVFSTWLRTTSPGIGELGGMSDLSKSTQILFWEIK